MRGPGLANLLQHLSHRVSLQHTHPHGVQESRPPDAQRELALLRDAGFLGAIAGQRVRGCAFGPGGVVRVAIEGKDTLAIRRYALPIIKGLVLIGRSEREDLIEYVEVVFCKETLHYIEVWFKG
jgi:hypothetical protein